MAGGLGTAGAGAGMSLAAGSVWNGASFMAGDAAAQAYQYGQVNYAQSAIYGAQAGAASYAVGAVAPYVQNAVAGMQDKFNFYFNGANRTLKSYESPEITFNTKFDIDYGDYTRVGRWMSPNEYSKMIYSGKVQESFSGTTHVANPADINAFIKQAKSGTIYAEFDVYKGSLRQTNIGWSKIIGPSSFEGRHYLELKIPRPEMPYAFNIRIRGGK